MTATAKRAPLAAPLLVPASLAAAHFPMALALSGYERAAILLPAPVVIALTLLTAS